MKLLWLLTTILFCDAQKIIYKYLNSYGHCSSGPTIVDSDNLYNLKADAQPGTKTQSSLVGCELVFRAEDEEGQLCIMQDDVLNTLEDPNVELILYDGYGDDEQVISTIQYAPSKWSDREYCSTSHFLTVKLRRINDVIPVDVSKLKVNLMVVNIKNKYRKIYLDELYCDDTFFLNNSVVRVYNRSPTSSTKKPTDECQVTIVKRSDGDSRLCLVYIPSDKPSPHARWLFVVSNTSYSLDEKNLMYKLSWNDTKIKTQHIWCATNNTSTVMLILKRLEKNTVSEPVESLSYILTDHVGPEEDLHKLVSEFTKTSDDTEPVEYWVIAIVALFIFIVFIIMVVLKRDYLKKIFCNDYHQANSNAEKTHV